MQRFREPGDPLAEPHKPEYHVVKPCCSEASPLYLEACQDVTLGRFPNPWARNGMKVYRKKGHLRARLAMLCEGTSHFLSE